MVAHFTSIMKGIIVQQISVGCWPIDKGSELKNKIYTFYAWVILILYTIKIILEFTYICGHTGNVFVLGEMFIIFFTGVLFQIRILNIFHRSADYQNLMIFFRDKISLSEYWDPSKKSMKIAMDQEREAKYLVMLFTVMFTFGYFIFFILTVYMNFISGSYEKDSDVPMLSPFTLALPFDTQFNKVNWSFTYVAECIFGYICLGSVLCQDVMLCYIILHVIGHLKIMICKLKQLHVISKSLDEHDDDLYDMEQIKDMKDVEKSWTEYSEEDENFIYAKMIDCLLHHALILRFFSDMQNVFGLIFFTNFLYDVSCICLLGFQMTSALIYTVIRFSLFFMGAVARLIMICYYCDQLAAESRKLCEAVYCSNWPSLSARCKSSLYFFLMRTQIPLQFSAMGFLSVTVETMSMILKSSFSYFTILRSFDE